MNRITLIARHRDGDVRPDDPVEQTFASAEADEFADLLRDFGMFLLRRRDGEVWDLTLEVRA